MKIAVIVWPDAKIDTLTAETPSRLFDLMRDRMVDSGWNGLDRFPEGYHALDHHEVWHLDDFLDEPVNPFARAMLGNPDLPPDCLRGPVAFVRLPDGEDNRAERAHQQAFFRALDLGA